MRIAVTGQVRLAREKAAAKARVAGAIDAARRLFITPLAGQDMIYLRKEAEARDYVAADPAPADLTDYPFIAAEVGVTAADAHGVAQVYLNLASQWRAMGAVLEGIRLTATKSIDEASTLGAISTAESAAQQAVEAILP